MTYHMELLARDRQDSLLREAEGLRLHRLVDGRTRSPRRPLARRVFNRS